MSVQPHTALTTIFAAILTRTPASARLCATQSFSVTLLWPAGRHHELRGAAGGPGAGDGKGTVQGDQPGHAVGLHRRHRGAAARRHLPVHALPRALWKTGCLALQRESCKSQKFIDLICDLGRISCPL